MLLYSNANAKLGTLCLLCMLDDWRKRVYSLRYRAPILFLGEGRHERTMTGLRHRPKFAIESCSDHLETAISRERTLYKSSNQGKSDNFFIRHAVRLTLIDKISWRCSRCHFGERKKSDTIAHSHSGYKYLLSFAMKYYFYIH